MSIRDYANDHCSADSCPRRWFRLLGSIGLASVATAVLTWPQLRFPGMVVDHFDPYFSVWRLGHIAHALRRWPVALFDANIFYPAKGTLAYSDATLLQGVLGAPLFWAGVSPTLIYNVLLGAGFTLSGAAMFVLARHLTGSTPSSLVAVVIFVMLPYRVEHLMHLELQWALFIPLTFWAIHRTAESGRWRHALLAGLFVWLQFLASIYYGVFLSLTLLIFVPLMLMFRGHAPRLVFLAKLSVGGLAAALLSLPYLWPYFEASRVVGTRQALEIAQYSAHLTSYLATSEWNRLWGWTAGRWGAMELRLFPGALALILATASVFHPRRRHVALYAVVLGVVVELSLGMNGSLYRLLLTHIAPLQAFRAVARFGMIVGCVVAILAAFGTQALLLHVSQGRWQRWLVSLLIAILFIEYSNRSIPLSYAIRPTPADAYKALSQAQEGAMVEMPLPVLNGVPNFDPYYQGWAVWHWRPLLNGYSGFIPAAYAKAVTDLENFPDAQSIETLRALNIRFVMVHQGFYEPDEYLALALKLVATPALKLWGTYKDPVGDAHIFEVGP